MPESSLRQSREHAPSRARSILLASAAALCAVTTSLAPASAASPEDLGAKVEVERVNRHLIALQRIADQHGGNRASGKPGYEASVDYVADQLRSAGFDVSTPEFRYDAYHLEHVKLLVDGADQQAEAMEYAPSTPEGGLKAPITVTKRDDPTPGCEPTDYDGLNVTGSVVLVQRGHCPFGQKAQVAADRGAAGVIFYNNTDGPLKATLGGPENGRIPALGVTKQAGEALAGKPGAQAHLELKSRVENVATRNVVAQTRTGRPDNVAMAGAHLDSVHDGAGINDNGTGTAGLLETALQLGGSPNTPNAVRFAFWGAEESGLIGSTKYVQALTPEQRLDIALYLNFDMIGSPNPAYFALDGDNSDNVGAGPGPQGSGRIEQDLVGAMKAQGVETEGTDFDGRSDYGEFIKLGIPAGGLFTGAEQRKTPAQAAKWGGVADQPYDPNYHTPKDNLTNVDRLALERNSKALASVIGAYAQSTQPVNGEAPAGR